MKKTNKTNNSSKTNTTNKAYYIFIIFNTIILLIIVLFAAFLSVIFKSPDIELETFDFSKHNKLVFDDAYRGSSPESKLTFAFFMDFKCPACVEQYPIIKNLMINHSNVNFLFKHLINPSNEDEALAATAFECAKAQGKGYTMADYLFSTQLTYSDLLNYAESIEINMGQFQECFSSDIVRNLIEADPIHASYLGVKGSPTIFINGIKIEGMHSYKVYEEIIIQELKELNIEGNENKE